MVVRNQPGVLSRVASLFTRRCYNIDSLTVSTTEDGEYSRITVVVPADEAMMEQVVKQVGKLIDVKVVSVLDDRPVTAREVALIKVRKQAGSELMDAISAAHGVVVDMGESTLTVEAIGNLEEIDGLVAALTPFGIVELARTGLVALSRGDSTLLGKF